MWWFLCGQVSGGQGEWSGRWSQTTFEWLFICFSPAFLRFFLLFWVFFLLFWGFLRLLSLVDKWLVGRESERWMWLDLGAKRREITRPCSKQRPYHSWPPAACRRLRHWNAHSWSWKTLFRYKKLTAATATSCFRKRINLSKPLLLMAMTLSSIGY